MSSKKWREANREKVRLYNRQWARDNPEKVKKHIKKSKPKNRQRIVDWYNDYKSKLKCLLCGESDPCCLKFHHVDPSSKIEDVSVMVRNGTSIDEILKEIEKCVVVCGNCHDKEHLRKKKNDPSELLYRSNMTFVKKGWGYERWIWNDDKYCGKVLGFVCDKKCSYHYHAIKDEVLFVHSGKIIMKYGDHDDLDAASEIIMEPGMAFHVTPGLRHQMIAEEDSLMYEFSTHHEDSDSYRIVRGD